MMQNFGFLPGRRCAAGLVLGLFALCAATPALAQPAKYEIDPNHLSIGFLVDHVGYAKTLGMFRTARGSYSFDEAKGELSDVRIYEPTLETVFIGLTGKALRD